MASALPLVHPKNSVVTIHDLAWEFYPETFKTFMRLYLRVFQHGLLVSLQVQ